MLFHFHEIFLTLLQKRKKISIFCRKFRQNVHGKKTVLEMIWTHCGSPCHYHMHRRQLKASFIGHPVLITSCKSWGKYSHIFHVKMALPQWPFLHVKPIFLAVISRTFFPVDEWPLGCCHHSTTFLPLTFTKKMKTSNRVINAILQMKPLNTFTRRK